MEERPDEHQEQEVPDLSDAEFLSQEEQERVLDEYARPQLEGLKSILAEKQSELAAGADEEKSIVLKSEIAELEETIAEMEEFLEDVTPEPQNTETQETDAEKHERIMGLLREAARQYQENHEKGEVAIAFRTDSGDTWYMPAQIADVADTEVVFPDGKTFPLQYVEDVEPTGGTDSEEGTGPAPV